MPAIRLLTAISCLALCSCATDTASRTELLELSANVRALHSENARLEGRLDKLEQQLALTAVSPSRPPVAAAPLSGPATPATSTLPPLTVVKLKPRHEPAPKINTNVDVQEPADDTVAELQFSDSSGTVTPAAAPSRGDEELEERVADTQYDHGLDALKTGNLKGGVAQLQQFAADWPRHPHADNALYFAALAMMSDQDFAGASKLLDLVITRYPAGDSVLDSMLRLAECRLKLNHPQEAKATWERIVAAFPGTTAATQAQARLASLSPPH